MLLAKYLTFSQHSITICQIKLSTFLLSGRGKGVFQTETGQDVKVWKSGEGLQMWIKKTEKASSLTAS